MCEVRLSRCLEIIWQAFWKLNWSKRMMVLSFVTCLFSPLIDRNEHIPNIICCWYTKEVIVSNSIKEENDGLFVLPSVFFFFHSFIRERELFLQKKGGLFIFFSLAFKLYQNSLWVNYTKPVMSVLVLGF